ncbi:MAG: MFS transporter [Peptococcaceae bacterium]|nr:MFS transporter [Peptococcaceae bacterium]
MKVSRTMLKLAIICIAIDDAANTASNPALGNILEAFKDVAPWIVQLIVTMPGLFVGIGPLIYAIGVRYTKKKTWIYIGGILLLVGGLMPTWLHSSVGLILIFRAMVGLGCGILTPMAVDLVVDFFEGKERHNMMGYVSAFVGVSAMLYQTIAGYLAGIQWNYCFLTYILVAPWLIFALIVLPEPKIYRKDALEAATSHAPSILGSGRVPGSVFVYVFLLFLFFIFWMVIPTNAAIILVGENMAVPAQIGLLFAVLSLGNVSGAALFGHLFKIFKHSLLPLSYIVGAAGIFICSQAYSLGLFAFGMFLAGLTMGITIPATNAKVNSLVTYSAASKAIGITFFGYGIGAFLSPIVFQFVGLPGRFVVSVGAVGILALCIVTFLVNKAFPSDTSGTNITLTV